MLCSNSEFEEPPGPGRPSYHRENVPPTRWYDWRSRSTYPLNRNQDTARVLRLTSEALAGSSAPGLFLRGAPPGFTHLMRSERATLRPENLSEKSADMPISPTLRRGGKLCRTTLQMVPERQIGSNIPKRTYRPVRLCTSLVRYKVEGNHER
jgi:hypothetical protein